MRANQQSRPYDSRFLFLASTPNQIEVYKVYGACGSIVNQTARKLSEMRGKLVDCSHVSQVVRCIQDKAKIHFGEMEYDDEYDVIQEQPLKILYFDIETAPNLGYTYPLWNANINHSHIVRYGYVLSFAAKWIGTDKTIYHECQDWKNKKFEEDRDDSEITKKMMKLFDQADIVVGHNGKAFDVDTMKGRALKWDLPPPTPFKVADTMRIAKFEFKLQRNSLEFIAEFVGAKAKQKHTQFPGQELFIACDRGNKEAWKILKEYNIGDVDTLIEVHQKLRAWDSRSPNLGVFRQESRSICPKCSSGELTRSKKDAKTNTQIYPLYFCRNCKGYSRGRHTISDISKRKILLVHAV